jgi:hypothetical protein
MAQVDKSTTTATSSSIINNLGEMTKQRVEASALAQTELFRELQEISQHWSARAKSEADLASELIGKLTSARSVPEGAKAYQEWAGQRMQRAVEDAQHLIADGFKLMETITRRFSSGSVPLTDRKRSA